MNPRYLCYVLTTIAVLPFISQANAADMGTAFTYQGSLEKPAGTPVTNTCDFRFGLWDDSVAGNQKGTSPQTVTGVRVTRGFFTATMDFGGRGIDGSARWLAIEVRCPAGVGGFHLVTPRVALAPAAHALALPGFYTQQTVVDGSPGTPNLIGGYNGNIVGPGVTGVTISGGGAIGFPNIICCDSPDYGPSNFATIGGGAGNVATGPSSTIGGGEINEARDYAATVGGGVDNRASFIGSTVGGGGSNTASNEASTVGGGEVNTASGQLSTVGGGISNVASGGSSTVGGGNSNTASGDYATIAGGGPSDPADYGTGNRVTDDYGTIGGGGNNQAGDDAGSTADHAFATVGGGNSNTASGFASTVPGGDSNAAGGFYSFAAGRRAKANNNGSFVWADSTDADFTSSADNEFRVRASGGTQIYSNSAASVGVQLAAGGNSWSAISDRNVKENVTPIDARDVLQRLAAIPVAKWNLISQDPSVRHIGPMAQDFYAAFGVGEMETHISGSDADGVALAAIQGLYQIVQEKDCEIEELRSEIENLKELMRALVKEDGGGR